ncbi:MAG: hypothetical protein ABI863_14455 [Ginsengibacter sp.]
MKKLLVAAFICLNIGFISCKKDRDKTHLVNGIDITGTWKAIYFETFNWAGGVGSVSFDTMQLPCIMKNKFTINADGTASSFNTGTDSCVWYRAPNLVILAGAPGQILNYTWTQSGDTLSFLYHTLPNPVFQSYFLKSGITNQLITLDNNSKTIWVK